MYIGEHTLFVQIAQILFFLTFVLVGVSGVFFYLAERESNKNWFLLGKKIYILHFLAICSVSFCLFWALAQHYFEINYIWKHSSLDMPTRYIMAAFWGGQEGSILCWIFFQSLIGLIFLGQKNSLALAFYTLLQCCLMTFLLGVFIDDLQIGSSPFTLMRQLPQNLDLPWTFLTDYLQKVPAFKDGQGLNPLLQNYWMVIHPPIIFLGFSLVQIPFVLALSAVVKNEHNNKMWLKNALPWTFSGIGILGIGILLGGAWAYESLSFGGFWAWDPVENAVLVPWLVLLATGHLMLLSYHSKRHIFSTVLLSCLSFILVIYSSFLTRSGVLADSSVHSFAGENTLWQWLFLQIFTIFLTIFFLLRAKNLRLQLVLFSMVMLLGFYVSPEIMFKIHKVAIYLSLSFIGILYFLFQAKTKYFRSLLTEEEKFYSREFFLFVGSFFLIISSFFVAFITSLPVLNLIFDTHFDTFTELKIRHQFYNPWMSFFFIVVILAMGFAQILKYKNTKNWNKNKTFFALITSVILSFLAYSSFLYFEKIGLLYLTLFAVCIFSIFLQVQAWKKFQKKWGSAMAHIGFALFLIAVVISMGQQKIISINQSAVSVETIDPEFSNNRNIILPKGEKIEMENYLIRYTEKKFRDSIHIDYQVDYFNKNEELLFSLYPFVQLNARFGNVAEPGTAHFWNKDIFTYLTFGDFQKPSTDLLDPQKDKMAWRKIIYQPKHFLTLEQNGVMDWKKFKIYVGQLTTLSTEDKTKHKFSEEDVVAVLPLIFSLAQGQQYRAYPLVQIKIEKNKNSNQKNEENLIFPWFEIPDLGYKIRLDAKRFDENFIDLEIVDTKPILYNGYQLYFSEPEIIEDGLEKEKANFFEDDFVYQMNVKVKSAKEDNEKIYEEKLFYAVDKKMEVILQPTSIGSLDLDLMIQGFGMEGEIVILAREKEFLVMQAIEFPAMMLVWFGAFLCFLGTGIAVVQRILKTKT